MDAFKELNFDYIVPMGFLLFISLMVFPLTTFAEEIWDDDRLPHNENFETTTRVLKQQSGAQMTAEELKEFLDDYYRRPWSERFGFEGQLRGRIRQEGPHSDKRFRVQPRVELDAFFDVTADGCLKARAKAATGDEFGNDWGDLETSDREQQLEFHLRRLYFDYELCNVANLHLEAGVLPVSSPGLLGPDGSGWTDGVRLRYTDVDGRTRWVLSVGEIDELETPNLFQRDFDGVNLYQASVEHQVNDKIKLISEIMNHADNLYVRAGTEVEVQKNTGGLVDSVYLENLWMNGNQQAAVVKLKKQMGRWVVELLGTHMRGAQYEGDLSLPLDGFLGGFINQESSKDGYLKVTFRFSKYCSWLTRVRAGDMPTRMETGFVCRR